MVDINCPQCKKKMGFKENNAIKAMKQALSMTEKFRGMGKVSKMLKMIDDDAGVDLATLNEYSKKNWCLDCIIALEKGK